MRVVETKPLFTVQAQEQKQTAEIITILQKADQIRFII